MANFMRRLFDILDLDFKNEFKEKKLNQKKEKKKFFLKSKVSICLYITKILCVCVYIYIYIYIYI